MRYVYMHNYRGFADTLIPISATSFLVGENSTGKSSFLKLLYLIGRPQFWFSPTFSLEEEHELAGFDDIVSASAKDRSSFQVGVVSTKNNKSDEISMTFSVHTFVERDGSPRLSRFSRLDGKAVTTLTFEKRRTKYRSIPCAYTARSEAEALAYFRQAVSSEHSGETGFKSFPKDFPPDPPLPLAISLARNIEVGMKLSRTEFQAEIPYGMDITWIAPIRTKPKRFYDAFQGSYSPEGEHTPYLLHTSLRARTKSARFAEKLAAFGTASGLFETVTTHSFGKTARAPFEIIVKLSGAALNINNVGYGVSQALPLVIEFLSKESKGAFAVQQPEVHLHPRAQAALGELIYELTKDRKHSFLLETHSDYLIDRFRLAMAGDKNPPSAQVLFFRRTSEGNHIDVIPLAASGRYPPDQPKEFRNFFIKEEMSLLEL